MPGRVYGTQRLQSTPGKVAAGPAPCPLVLHPLTGFTELRTHTTSTDTSCGAPPSRRLTLTELCTSARMGVTQAAGTRGSQDQASHASKKCSDRPFDPVMKPWVSGPQHGPRPAANSPGHCSECPLQAPPGTYGVRDWAAPFICVAGPAHHPSHSSGGSKGEGTLTP